MLVITYCVHVFLSVCLSVPVYYVNCILSFYRIATFVVNKRIMGQNHGVYCIIDCVFVYVWVRV